MVLAGFFTRCFVLWMWEVGTSSFLFAASRFMCSCIPNFVFIHFIFLVGMICTCLHSSYMCFPYIITFFLKNINCSWTRDNLLQIKTPDIFSHLDGEALVIPKCGHFFVLFSAFMHCMCLFIGLCIGKFWEIIANVHTTSVGSFATVCYLKSPLSIGTETVVLISYHIHLAVLLG